MRPSTERIEAIRELAKEIPFPAMNDLLAEIDRLRVELSDRESNVQDLQEVAESWMNDADQLRVELSDRESNVQALQEKLKVAEKEGKSEMSEQARINIDHLYDLWGRGFTDECINEGFTTILKYAIGEEQQHLARSVPIELILAVAIKKLILEKGAVSFEKIRGEEC